MAIQTTPHTQTQQNVDSTLDTEPGLDRLDVGRGDDATLYENNDGAQTGGTRAFNANAGRDNAPRVNGETGEESGNGNVPQDGQVGITNHTTEERERQEKVSNS